LPKTQVMKDTGAKRLEGTLPDRRLGKFVLGKRQVLAQLRHGFRQNLGAVQRADQALIPRFRQFVVHPGRIVAKGGEQVALFSPGSTNSNTRTGMRFILTSLSTIALFATAQAQYGSFDAGAVKAAKGTTTIVVLDAGDSPYNRMMMNAVKAEWKFTAAYEFVTVAELGTQPIDPAKTYLLKTSKVDPVKFEATFITLVRGWKQKKGEPLQQTNNAFTSIAAEQELAFIMIDPKAINEKNMAAMLTVYVKHLQDYLKLVETGKITDKATADRTYSSRSRLVRDTELLLAREHMDKSLPDAAAIAVHYTAPTKLVGLAEITAAVEAQNRSITLSDVLLTGDHKNKHCFKRVFNAGTGELMYLADDAAIFGKKEGLIDVDLKNIARAR
jgi:hypothetical protein